ncbi:HK97 family phage prohead protease [Hymenobacter sp. M29]|uniref:HK97 family phage prohead protease n=1 Tax=Hymenobacter mellowenesis TaxID=3063995 RepID=A0ABT9AEP8_9BACT|nr:HK97 family phage prohead protease [Hymenobacter sp. M29]MDO7847461.1 HK97 family phage prohead protease [Hymenobacter sp. M29]
MRRFEYKTNTLNLELKDINPAKRQVLFYAAAFHSVDAHNDIILPGAFTKSITENLKRIKWFKNHDSNQMIGSVKDAVEDGHGLLVTAQAANTPLGDETLAHEAEGNYEHSIGYQVILKESNTKGTRLLKQLKLWEVTSTAHGSNEHTPTMGFKSLLEMTPDEQTQLIQRLHERSEKLQKSLRSGNLDDEKSLLLAMEAIQIQQGYADLLEKALTPQEPAPATPQVVVEPLLTVDAIRAVYEKYK